MTHPNFFILYVENPMKSVEFYRGLLGKEPLDASPGFAMFSLDSGVMLGLWAKSGVTPAARLSGGGTELAISVESKAAVDTMYRNWKALAVPVVQEPCDLDFGYTFVAEDPDGHRLRPFVPHQG